MTSSTGYVPKPADFRQIIVDTTVQEKAITFPTDEPVIGHLKNEHRMGRNHLAGRDGDAANAVLAAAGYNFALLLSWLELLLRVILMRLAKALHLNRAVRASLIGLLHGRRRWRAR